ncbi:GNAT family N-acetyltransferase [Pyruvatibacter sp.]|uniref:GNAT family N-acetyltransferase n=1 Tax=Pyruvatibacter sp. TaxID=1981328 RepID=UPI0032663C5F
MAHTLPGMSDILIETDRLIMRPLASGYADDYARIASDARIGAVMSHIPTPCPAELVQQWSARVPELISAGTDYQLIITTKSDGALLGATNIGCMVELGVSGRQYELSYWVDPARWGEGFATECAIGCRDWAFEILKAGGLRAACAMGNTASARVLENAGFHFMNTAMSASSDADDAKLRNNYRMDKPRWETLKRRPHMSKAS